LFGGTSELGELNGIVLTYRVGFESWQGLQIFLLTTISKLFLRPTQPPVQWVLGALSLGVKLTTHFHLMRICGAIPPFPNMPSWRGAQLKARATLPYLYSKRENNITKYIMAVKKQK
jgi:hypothetical protein